MCSIRILTEIEPDWYVPPPLSSIAHSPTFAGYWTLGTSTLTNGRECKKRPGTEEERDALVPVPVLVVRRRLWMK